MISPLTSQCRLLNNKTLHAFAVLNLLHSIKNVEEAWSSFSSPNFLSSCCQSLQILGSWLLSMQVPITAKLTETLPSNERREEIVEKTILTFLCFRELWFNLKDVEILGLF